MTQSFLIAKVQWLHKRTLDRVDRDIAKIPKEIKAQVFQTYLEEELVYLIKYLEEYAFIQNHKKEKDFSAIETRYKPILLWGVRKFGTVMRKNEHEDLLQEFTLVLWKCIHKWHGFPNAKAYRNRSQMLGFSTYLKAALQNRCRDIWRGNDTDKRKVLGLTVGSLDDGEDSFVGQLVAKQITQKWLQQELEEQYSDSTTLRSPCE